MTNATQIYVGPFCRLSVRNPNTQLVDVSAGNMTGWGREPPGVVGLQALAIPLSPWRGAEVRKGSHVSGSSDEDLASPEVRLRRTLRGVGQLSLDSPPTDPESGSDLPDRPTRLAEAEHTGPCLRVDPSRATQLPPPPAGGSKPCHGPLPDQVPLKLPNGGGGPEWSGGGRWKVASSVLAVHPPSSGNQAPPPATTSSAILRASFPGCRWTARKTVAAGDLTHEPCDARALVNRMAGLPMAAGVKSC